MLTSPRSDGDHLVLGFGRRVYARCSGRLSSWPTIAPPRRATAIAPSPVEYAKEGRRDGSLLVSYSAPSRPAAAATLGGRDHQFGACSRSGIRGAASAECPRERTCRHSERVSQGPHALGSARRRTDFLALVPRSPGA